MATTVAKAMTPTLAPGNKHFARAVRGFTLIELLVVVAMIAIAVATVSLALRDPAADQLEREAERLIALFETARAESRATGQSVQWTPVANRADEQFRFDGLPPKLQLPRRWLGEPVAVEIGAGARVIKLGPEPMIGAQSVLLSLGSQRVTLSTDGLAPFAITPTESNR